MAILSADGRNRYDMIRAICNRGDPLQAAISGIVEHDLFERLVVGPRYGRRTVRIRRA
ncbi:MAG: hypothetical protein O3B95_03545 [Chloroflexi bacterium]|nr:hypothetical protein [Chloroflexota bacterium]